MIAYVNFFLYAIQNVGDGMLRYPPTKKKTSVIFITVREFSAGGDLGQALIELIRISLSFTVHDRASTSLLIAKINHYVISLPVINNRFLFTYFSCSHSFIFNWLTFVHVCPQFAWPYVSVTVADADGLLTTRGNQWELSSLRARGPSHPKANTLTLNYERRNSQVN